MDSLINTFRKLIKGGIIIFFISLFLNKYALYLTVVVYHIAFSMYWIQSFLPIPTDIIGMIFLLILFTTIYKKI